ncbi:class I SAM-dependent methyltransferase [Archangium violaceum]|uniref:class I SAM-dependent methyltransferase n=1 Tax=Archangium violaceum TaxID=83451 RepID=UPI000697F22C|nr:class I SAM-dependent methyltransferase [Archangium violaceum]
MTTPTSRDHLLGVLTREFEQVYLTVCARGFSALGRTSPNHPVVRDDAWQHHPAWPPSYEAHGRYRVLDTLRKARALRPERVLEIATGGGFTAACLYEEGREVVANDLQPTRELFGAWTTGERLRWEAGDFFALDPERLGTFDLVLACEVIEHVAHGDRMLAHLRRFLRPGGTLMLTTPNGAYFRSKLPTHSQVEDFTALESQQFKPDADGHLFLYTAEELERLCRAAGFTQVDIELSVTPFLSGHAGVRLLPSRPALGRVYLALDTWVRRMGPAARERLCTQMLVTARVP